MPGADGRAARRRGRADQRAAQEVPKAACGLTNPNIAARSAVQLCSPSQSPANAGIRGRMSFPDPDALLTRKAAAAALTAAGFPTSPATLATKATRGGGPRYRKWSTRPLYRWADCLAWAQNGLGPAISSTSEADAV